MSDDDYCADKRYGLNEIFGFGDKHLYKDFLMEMKDDERYNDILFTEYMLIDELRYCNKFTGKRRARACSELLGMYNNKYEEYCNKIYAYEDECIKKNVYPEKEYYQRIREFRKKDLKHEINGFKKEIELLDMTVYDNLYELVIQKSNINIVSKALLVYEDGDKIQSKTL
jgi:hypothetical protein